MRDPTQFLEEAPPEHSERIDYLFRLIERTDPAFGGGCDEEATDWSKADFLESPARRFDSGRG
jgi:hypothetical protein